MYYQTFSGNQPMSINPDLILSAINVVLDWELPDEAFAEAVSGQARLMAGGFSD